MNKPVVETLATGDEVVNGDVVDSNSAFVARELAHRGVLLTRHNALPDDMDLLAQGLREISARADLCICSGGLGPTEDDLTADVAAQVAGVGVGIDEEAVKRMKERFAKFNYRLTANSSRTARAPHGSQVFQNEVGTAPAFSMRIGKCQFFFLPGVPKEFRFFVRTAILPWIESHLGGGFGAVMQLKTLGLGESHVAEKFEDFGRVFPQVKVGYRAHNPEVWLKLTAESTSREAALKLLEPAIQEAERRIGSIIFARGDDELDDIVHQLLIDQGVTLSLAESCTGGLIAHLLTSHSGSSTYFQGGVVSYSNESKSKLLGVPTSVLSSQGAVSRACAEAMAAGSCERFGSRLAVSVTGIAGPGGATDEKPVGLVYFALCDAQGTKLSLERRFRGDRERVQRAAALTALEMVRRHLTGAPSLTDGLG